MHRLRFDSFGVAAEIACDDRALLGAIEGVLPPGWHRSDRTPQVRFALTRAGTVTVDGVEFHHPEIGYEEALPRLASVVRHELALHAPAHIFIHAGVVAADGAAIVLPGSSGSGKTTLVAELVRAGAGYCSDEFAVVDGHGRLQPYPKPLSIRGERAVLGAPVPVPAERTVREAVRPALIVFTRYEPRARWDPVELTAAEGALALLEHTVAARSRPGPALAVVARVAREARVIASPRGGSDAAAAALLEALAESVDPSDR
ncbi:MAG TPA: hypothetical protein VHX88_21480 [Solirubrobacteraceae bacterium]|jgi:hypothetical protein|nr:hypothetical protein [Solirubrobacteraceae bacterium]